MLSGQSAAKGPPVGQGIKSQLAIGNLEAFSAFGVGGWVIAKNPSMGPLSVHVVTPRSFDIGTPTLPRPDVVMGGYDTLHCGFNFPLTNWLGLGIQPDDTDETVTLLVMQGGTPCYRANFKMAPASLLVPQFRFNVETFARTHISGWIASSDPSPLAAVLVNEHGEEHRFVPAMERADLDAGARAFWEALPLRFLLRQSRLQLFAEQRGRRVLITELRPPNVVTFLEELDAELLRVGPRPDFLRGWAVNLLNPARRPKVVLSSGTAEIWSAHATLYRRDLMAQTGMDGFCAFSAPLGMIPAEAPWKLSVRDADEVHMLASSEEA
ncbi:hypothetical protein [Ancylobacter defluvii]|uniref:Uncharacterized protein n=1 Tax=Ancylobacter defluvii TaxID=1282440 RepID=A0A9W6NAX5_9HYPH|nr:hypothetical protein [Ancylobacter defluvii]MBS7588641.1 hypothetical protein [Ancylobacter defluvii]GLK83921.1 hypothetical protein GCM10017653_19910 [Ancylobacter defluvii]